MRTIHYIAIILAIAVIFLLPSCVAGNLSKYNHFGSKNRYNINHSKKDSL